MGQGMVENNFFWSPRCSRLSEKMLESQYQDEDDDDGEEKVFISNI